MKIKKSVLEKIIREELLNRFSNLLEAESPGVEDAEQGSKSKQKKPSSTKPDDKKKPPAPPKKPDQKADDPAEKKPEVPDAPDPADDELEKDEEEAGDEDGDGSDKRTGKVADELVGKTVQSISAEPKSKLMPGAMEIVVTFDQIPDPLRILVTKTGTVKYYFKGALHNEL